MRAPQWEEGCGLSINTHKLDSRLAVKVGQLSVLLSAPSWLLVVLYCARVLFYMLFRLENVTKRFGWVSLKMVCLALLMRVPPPFFLIGKSCPLALHEDKCFSKSALTGHKWRLRPRGSLLPSLSENSVQLSRTASFYPCALVLVPQLPTPSEAHAHRQADCHLLIPVLWCPLPQT